MDEAEARSFVPRETLPPLDAFVALLRDENERQNLVSRGSLEKVWSRHIADSAQLVRFAPAAASSWLDLGSGAGFPGLIVALLHPARMILVESRRLRADFLKRGAALLGVNGKVEIVAAKAETLPERPFDVISARAFAPLDALFAAGARFSTAKTVWILPKGRGAQTELEACRASWQGDFRLEPSLTDPEARIIVASGVRRTKREKKDR
jgi:16S rRNA (guanine527-N7)-methyltransferase